MSDVLSGRHVDVEQPDWATAVAAEPGRYLARVSRTDLPRARAALAAASRRRQRSAIRTSFDAGYLVIEVHW